MNQLPLAAANFGLLVFGLFDFGGAMNTEPGIFPHDMFHTE